MTTTLDNPAAVEVSGRREIRACEVCGTPFVTWPSKRRRACSPGCGTELRRHPRNGGLQTSDGRTYIVHRDGKARTPYYRALMEAHLGRELRHDEHVHHINGDRSDDRIENLQVLTAAEHARLHDPGPRKLTAAAVAIIRASCDDARSLAQRFGVTRRSIYHVREGRTWR